MKDTGRSVRGHGSGVYVFGPACNMRFHLTGFGGDDGFFAEKLGWIIEEALK